MVKKLLMGNEAIALGALRAGVRVATGYPGTPSSEILETLAKEITAGRRTGVYAEWSVNEKSALELASGAAIAGARSLVTMKQVGLNVASDPLMSLNYTGIKAGMVVIVCDDPGPISSQTEQDTRRFAAYAKLCCFDPSTPEEAYLMVADAFSLSERIGRPVLLRPTTRVCHAYASVELADDIARKDITGFGKDDGRWVIFPKLAYNNKLLIESTLEEMSHTLSTYPGNHSSGSADAVRGVATGGVSAAYTAEALRLLSGEYGDGMPPIKLLKVGAYPFPSDTAASFLSGLEDVIAIEELDPVIEDELVRVCHTEGLRVHVLGKRAGYMPVAGELSTEIIKEKLRIYLALGDVWKGISDNSEDAEEAVPPLPVRPPVLCAGCPHRGSFFAVKEAMKGRSAVYCGDIGCYTLGNAMPLDMVDTCLCMGAGLTQAQGIRKAAELAVSDASDASVASDEPSATGIRQSSESSVGGSDLPVCFAFIGDSTYFHTGLAGVVNAVYGSHDVVYCILDNSTTAMTGGQTHPGLGRTLLGDEAPKISIEETLRAFGVQDIQTVDAFDFEEAKAAVMRASEKSGVRAIIFRGMCVNLIPKGESLAVDEAKCIGCGICIDKLGCPALRRTDADAKSKASIVSNLCTGCGLCTYLCKPQAIG